VRKIAEKTVLIRHSKYSAILSKITYTPFRRFCSCDC